MNSIFPYITPVIYPVKFWEKLVANIKFYCSLHSFQKMQKKKYLITLQSWRRCKLYSRTHLFVWMSKFLSFQKVNWTICIYIYNIHPNNFKRVLFWDWDVLPEQLRLPHGVHLAGALGGCLHTAQGKAHLHSVQVNKKCFENLYVM